MDESIPADSNKAKEVTLSFSQGNFEDPVLVDILTGAVYDIPAGRWKRDNSSYTFRNIPVYDSPVLIADRSLIRFR
jgi:hypothetical protein